MVLNVGGVLVELCRRGFVWIDGIELESEYNLGPRDFLMIEEGIERREVKVGVS